MDDLANILTTDTPTLVVLMSLLIMILALVFVIKIKIEESKIRKWIVGITLAEYIFVILCETVFYREKNSEANVILEPFWSYREAFNYLPSLYMLWEVLLNIILFIPIGIFISIIVDRIRWWQVLTYGGILSVFIEVSQFLFHNGLCETDDIINNTIGKFIGFIVIKIVSLAKRINIKEKYNE